MTDPITKCLALYALDQIDKKRPQTLEQWAKGLPNKAPLIKWYKSRNEFVK